MLRIALVAALLCACGGSSNKPTTTTTAPAGDKLLVLVDDQGVALGGNDPIAYTTNAVSVGTADHKSVHGGATYQFATPENKATFDGAQTKYAPAFGGYCAFAASQNRLSESDPAVYLIHEGQLLMFTNADFLEQFKKDAASNKQKADANWPGLVAQHGKPKA
ncbi:MAG: YHS domain-containing protein [Myxococcota bacterium]|nr:YHS domain-containing protein [Deltaproteobacteria bacterium]MDQ3335653.1 YHS domain-containing protein [Myxococcota bacterium]